MHEKLETVGTPHRTHWIHVLPATLFIIVNNLHSIQNLRVRWILEFDIDENEKERYEQIKKNSALDIVERICSTTDGEPS